MGHVGWGDRECELYPLLKCLLLPRTSLEATCFPATSTNAFLALLPLTISNWSLTYKPPPPTDGTTNILLSKKPYNVQEYRKVAGSNIVFLFKGLSLVVPYIPFWVVVELEKWTSKPITKNGNQNLWRNSMFMLLLLLLFFVVRCVYIIPKNASTQS